MPSGTAVPTSIVLISVMRFGVEHRDFRMVARKPVTRLRIDRRAIPAQRRQFHRPVRACPD